MAVDPPSRQQLNYIGNAPTSASDRTAFAQQAGQALVNQQVQVQQQAGQPSAQWQAQSGNSQFAGGTGLSTQDPPGTQAMGSMKLDQTSFNWNAQAQSAAGGATQPTFSATADFQGQMPTTAEGKNIAGNALGKQITGGMLQGEFNNVYNAMQPDGKAPPQSTQQIQSALTNFASQSVSAATQSGTLNSDPNSQWAQAANTYNSAYTAWSQNPAAPGASRALWGAVDGVRNATGYAQITPTGTAGTGAPAPGTQAQSSTGGAGTQAQGAPGTAYSAQVTSAPTGTNSNTYVTSNSNANSNTNTNNKPHEGLLHRLLNR